MVSSWEKPRAFIIQHSLALFSPSLLRGVTEEKQTRCVPIVRGMRMAFWTSQNKKRAEKTWSEKVVGGRQVWGCVQPDLFIYLGSILRECISSLVCNRFVRVRMQLPHSHYNSPKATFQDGGEEVNRVNQYVGFTRVVPPWFTKLLYLSLPLPKMRSQLHLIYWTWNG